MDYTQRWIEFEKKYGFELNWKYHDSKNHFKNTPVPKIREFDIIKTSMDSGVKLSSDSIGITLIWEIDNGTDDYPTISFDVSKWWDSDDIYVDIIKNGVQGIKINSWERKHFRNLVRKDFMDGNIKFPKRPPMIDLDKGMYY